MPDAHEIADGLRNYGQGAGEHGYPNTEAEMEEAADTLELLEAENQRLRKQVEAALDGLGWMLAALDHGLIHRGAVDKLLNSIRALGGDDA